MRRAEKFSKFIVITGLVTLIVTSSALPNAIGASIAGSACSKAGITKVVSNKKYTCVKSGKKLIWDKGVAVKTTATKAPTADPIIVSALGPRYAIANQMQSIADKLFANSKGLKVEDPIMHAEKTTTAVKANSLGAKTARQMIMGFSPMFPNFDFYLYDSKAWINSQMQSACPQLANNITGDGAEAGCGKLIISNLNSFTNTPTKISNEPQQAYLESAHETFHLAQSFFGNQGGGADWNLIPAWYREGTAMVFGTMVASEVTNKNPNYATIAYKNGNAYSKAKCQARYERWRIDNSAEANSANNNCEYGLGQVMVELMVSKTNAIDPLLMVYQLVAIGNSFDDAFKYATGGISKADFFSEMDGYLTSIKW